MPSRGDKICQSNQLDDQAYGLAIRVVAAHYPVIFIQWGPAFFFDPPPPLPRRIDRLSVPRNRKALPAHHPRDAQLSYASVTLPGSAPSAWAPTAWS